MRFALLVALCIPVIATAQDSPLGLSPEEVQAENTKLSLAACNQGNRGDGNSDGQSAADYLAGGERQRCAGDYERAAATLQEGATKFTERARDFELRLIRIRLAQRRPAEASALAERLLQRDPKDYEALAARASIRLYTGKPEQIPGIVVDLQTAVKQLPASAALSYDLGRALLAGGNTASARTQFDAALRLQADYLPARAALAMLMFARRENAEALKAADEMQRLDPENAFARLLRATVYLWLGRLPEAEAEMADAVRKNPANRDALYQYGYILFKAEKAAQAESVFERIYVQDPPDIRGLLGLTELYAAQGQWDRAFRRLDEAILKSPSNTTLRIAWGNIAVRAGRSDAAIVVFLKLLAADPDNLDLHMRLGEAYRQKPDLPKAIEIWTAASAFHPNQVAPILSPAMALEQMGKTKEAAPLYERVLELEPANTIALNNYAYLLASANTDLARALNYARQAKANAPSDPMIADTLGFVYLKNKLPEQAVAEFRALADKFPSVALFRIHLAESHLLNGDKEAAKRELDAAREFTLEPAHQAEFNALLAKLE